MGKGLSEGKQLSKKRFALKGRELLGMWVQHGLRSTVFAGQATGLGHFPVDEHRISGKIKPRELAAGCAPTMRFLLRSDRLGNRRQPEEVTALRHFCCDCNHSRPCRIGKQANGFVLRRRRKFCWRIGS